LIVVRPLADLVLPDQRRRPLVLGLSVVVPVMVCAAYALRDPAFSTSATLVLVLLVVVAATSGQRVAAVLAAASGGLGFDYFLTQPYHSFVIYEPEDVEVTVLLVVIGAIVAEVTTWGLRQQERLHRTERHRANLARFFSPRRVDELMEVDTPLSVARYQPAAVLFVDMVGFTAYCSTLAPDAVIAMLRKLMTLLSASVFSHEGTIDKFLGDGLLAVFGAPVPGPRDATNAARCALDMLASIDRWHEHDHRPGDDPIQVAVGIHYGDVVQGDIGSDKQLELTVLGDTVNIASRVEGRCRSLDAAVLVTDAVVDALRSEGSDGLAARFADQGRHLLRGRAEPIHLYGMKRSDVPVGGMTRA
jgi:class 3 adenylate cyclase